MDYATLVNVYFRLGATTKEDADTIGGFGRARILTCFAMRRYAIHASGLVVEGDGAHYEISCTDVKRKGVLVEIDIDHEDASYGTLDIALHDYLRLSHMSSRVIVNGEPFTEWLYRGRKTRDLVMDGEKSLIAVHVNKSGNFKGCVIVRIDGTFMYRRMTRAPFQFILEIDRASSRKILNANRDEMRSAYSCKLDEFLEEVAVDSISATRSRKRNLTEIVRGYGMILPRAPSRIALAPEASSFLSDDRPREYASASFEPAPTVERTPAKAIERLLPDLQIVDESENRAIGRAIPLFRPENWDVPGFLAKREGRSRKAGSGYNVFRLLMAWQAACSEAVTSLLELDGIEEMSWSVGWIFSSSETGAECRKFENGHVFLLNPVDDRGRVAWRLSDRRDLNRLLALARHEVVHVAEKWHDEFYARHLTRLDGEMDDAASLRRMRASF